MISPLIAIPKGRKGTNLEKWSTMSPEQLAQACNGHNGNRGVRLDNYAVPDPDEKAAEELLNQWEREGKLPPTVAWRTASGFTKRLFLRPEGLKTALSIPAIKLQLRTGAGMYEVIPPSYVKDPEKGIDGKYAWLPDQDPASIEPALLPEGILEYFLKHSSISSTSTRTDRSTSHANLLDFSEGSRDDSLFSVANALAKGGMSGACIEQLIKIIANSCSPPFSEKEALRKVESALKRVQARDLNLAVDVREWVLSSSGIFQSSDVIRELGLSSLSSDRKFNQNLSNALGRLVDEGLLERHGGRRGHFRLIEKECEALDFLMPPLKSWPSNGPSNWKS
jgi:hypothetical protein